MHRITLILPTSCGLYYIECLSYGVAVIQWITSYNKYHITTRVITLWRENVTSLTTSLSRMRFLLK